MRLLLVASLLATKATAFFFATIPNNAYARPPEPHAAPACAPCEPPTFAPLPTFAPIELPTLGPLPTLPPFEWPTLPPATGQAALAAQGYVQPPKPLELPTLAPLEPLPTMEPIELPTFAPLPTLPPFELPKAPDTYVQPKPLELPTLPPFHLEPLPTLPPFELPTFAPLPPAPEYVLPTLPPFEFPKLPDTYVQPPKPIELPTFAPLVLPTLAPLEPLPTMAPLVLPTLPPFETPKIPDAYPKPLEFPTLPPLEPLPTLPPFKMPEPVYVQPLEFPTFAPLAPLPTLAPFVWPTFAPLVAPAEGYATAPPQYVVPPAPKVTNDIVTESGAVGGVEEAAPLEAVAVEAAEKKETVEDKPLTVDNVDASTSDEAVPPPPPVPEVEGEKMVEQVRREERAPPDCTDFLGYLTSVDCWLEYRIPEGVVRPEIPTAPVDEPFVQTNVISDADLVEGDHPKTFEDAVVTSNKLRLRRGSQRHLEGIRRIVL